MEHDDLRALWEAQNATLETIVHFNAAAATASAQRKTSVVLDRLAGALTREAVLGFIPLALLMSFAADRIAQPGVFIAAAILAAYGVVLFAETIRQLVLVRTLDPSAPVVAIQQRLAQVRRDRVRTIFASLALGPLMWVPILIVVANLIGLDPLALGSGYLAANAAFGVAFLAVSVVAARRYGASLAEGSPARAIADALAGASLERASKELAAVVSFKDAA